MSHFRIGSLCIATFLSFPGQKSRRCRNLAHELEKNHEFPLVTACSDILECYPYGVTGKQDGQIRSRHEIFGRGMTERLRCTTTRCENVTPSLPQPITATPIFVPFSHIWLPNRLIFVHWTFDLALVELTIWLLRIRGKSSQEGQGFYTVVVPENRPHRPILANIGPSPLSAFHSASTYPVTLSPLACS